MKSTTLPLSFRNSLAAFFGTTAGSILFVALAFMKLFTRKLSPVFSEIPGNAIVYFSHSHLYLQQIDPAFSQDGECALTILTDHSIVSYMWYPWNLLQGLKLTRIDWRAKVKPFHQITEHLNNHPNECLGICTDSGGPYGQVRSSLLGLAQKTGRPLVALSIHASRSFKIMHHVFPVPFATVQSKFSQPIYQEHLKGIPDEAALQLLQNSWEQLQVVSRSQ